VLGSTYDHGFGVEMKGEESTVTLFVVDPGIVGGGKGSFSVALELVSHNW